MVTRAIAAQLDHALENIDADIAQAAERMQAAERALAKARDIYGRRIETRDTLRSLRG